ncbi:MAG: nucleotidyltransferase family protein [Burkholderiaceae bacterium]|nr:nucleotidyltransferase family protein [Burkholderiaceae bacterium]MEB2351083.1 nucleotidyltransferase family protein [Burkholderiaceae bacterium]
MDSIGPAGETPVRAGALLLAAGRSVRMGGPNKLLLELDGEPMVRRALRTLQAVPLDPVVVVLGAAAEAVRAALAGLPACRTCSAPQAEDHQASVDAGLRALVAPMEAIVIMLADQPLLDADDLRWLLAQWSVRARGGALVPMFAGQRGNPVIVDAALRAPILEAGPAVGARGYLAAHPSLVHRVETPNDHFVVDVDTADDLARLAGRGLRAALPGAG